MAKQITLAGYPNPKQIAFFEAEAPHIAYGGARGGGKSWAMRRKFVLLAIHHDGLKLLLLRRTFAELEGNHILPLMTELNGFATYNTEKRVFRFPNGSFIKLGYCDTEKDVFQYQGQEYDVIGLEEATQFTEQQMKFIATCNRTTRNDFTPRIYYTMNPGGPGHNYIKRLFVDRHFIGNENPEDYVFIPAKVSDNTVLMENDPGYVKHLETLPPHLRKAYLDGNWDVVEGQYFEEFNRERHVVKPFTIPDDWKRFRAMDWGFNDPCCVLWFAMAPDRRLYVYREIYQNHTIAADMANLIKTCTYQESISYTVASPDMWQNRGARDVMGGENIAETFMKLKVPLIKADNSRIIGWQRVRENLVVADDGLPYLQIFENCENLIRTLPVLNYDTNNHEDVSSSCEDHAAEALRYGLMSRPSPAKKKPGEKDRVLAFDPFYEPRRQASGGYLML